MKNKADLIAELAAAKQRRKPVISEDDQKALDETAKLQAELDAEYRALRLEENEDIRKEHAPTKARAFFDFDENMVHPATIEHNGRKCTLHSRFVVRHANKADNEVYDDAKRAAANATDPIAAARASLAADDTMGQLARRCIVYPVRVIGSGSAQYDLDIEASLSYFMYASATLGNAAARLGGLGALEHQAKS